MSKIEANVTAEQASEILEWLCSILDADVYERFVYHRVKLADGRILDINASCGCPSKEEDGTRVHVLGISATTHEKPNSLQQTNDTVFYRSDGRAQWSSWRAGAGWVKLATVNGGCFDN